MRDENKILLDYNNSTIYILVRILVCFKMNNKEKGRKRGWKLLANKSEKWKERVLLNQRLVVVGVAMWVCFSLVLSFVWYILYCVRFPLGPFSFLLFFHFFIFYFYVCLAAQNLHEYMLFWWLLLPGFNSFLYKFKMDVYSEHMFFISGKYIEYLWELEFDITHESLCNNILTCIVGLKWRGYYLTQMTKTILM